MSNSVTCLLCDNYLLAPEKRKKEFGRNHSFTCNCKAQYQYTYNNGPFQLVGMQYRFNGWNMWYSVYRDNTRYVKIARRNKDEESRDTQREEYTFDGLIKPEKFLNMKVFL